MRPVLPPDEACALLQRIAPNPHASSALIQSLAHLQTRRALDDSWSSLLLQSAAHHPVAAQRALAALLGCESHGAAERMDTLIDGLITVVCAHHDALDAVIDVLSSAWTRLSPHGRACVLGAATQRPQLAQRLLAHLVAHGTALTPATMQRLIAAAIVSVDAGVELIEALAPHWERIDTPMQDALMGAAWQRFSAAQRALAALLPHTRTDARGGWGTGARTLERALRLACVLFPNAAWDAPDVGAVLHRPESAPVLHYLLADAVGRPMAHHHHATLRTAWAALSPHDQHALIRLVASDTRLTVALGRMVADHDLPLDARAQRRLVRTLIPVRDALDALRHMTEPSDAIACWAPPLAHDPSPPDDPGCRAIRGADHGSDDSMDADERAAWRQAPKEGVLPLHMGSILALILGDPPAPQRHAAAR